MARMAVDHDATGRSGRRTLCLTGPESTGKSTLARSLAARFGAPLVTEIAREYLSGRTSYAAEDVLAIARRQLERETAARARTGGLLILDTDLTVIQVWWEEKYGQLPDELVEALEQRTERAYLLLAPDLPWTEDPLREHPHDRDRLFERYRQILAGGDFPHAIVSGHHGDRLTRALSVIEELFGGPAMPPEVSGTP
jgi:nicotinamide riboside kinase